MLLLIIASVVVFLLGSLLILLVFLQNPKDEGGMNTLTLGSGMQQLIGVAHTSSVLERATYVLAGLIFALTLLIAFSIEQRTERVVEQSAIITKLEKYAEKKKGEEDKS